MDELFSFRLSQRRLYANSSHVRQWSASYVTTSYSSPCCAQRCTKVLVVVECCKTQKQISISDTRTLTWGKTRAESCIWKGRAVVPAVSHRLPTAEARFRSQLRSYGICDGKCVTGAGFSRVLLFPLPVIPPIAPHSSLSIILGWYSRPYSDRRRKCTQSNPTPSNRRKYVRECMFRHASLQRKKIFPLLLNRRRSA
jgi:hypothetical protein